ncbi:unnamed protein product [Toxocara canis]|uniref:COMM domain-containing protein n=1 Tax=Toxocara canis TaxID=6265 RepID=A0A183UX80_TOXCA|nr:unnamed protein product [Toxocara canis]
MVSSYHEMEEFSAITPEQMKCLVWICGLHIPDDADIRTRTSRKMEGNSQTTLKELSFEIQKFLNMRQDAQLLGSLLSLLQPEVNAVTIQMNKEYSSSSSTSKRNHTRDPFALLSLWKMALGERMQLDQQDLQRLQTHRSKEGLLQEFRQGEAKSEEEQNCGQPHPHWIHWHERRTGQLRLQKSLDQWCSNPNAPGHWRRYHPAER